MRLAAEPTKTGKLLGFVHPHGFHWVAWDDGTRTLALDHSMEVVPQEPTLPEPIVLASLTWLMFWPLTLVS